MKINRWFWVCLLPVSALALVEQAEVLSVDTITKTQIERIPYEHCYTEELPIYTDQRHPSHTREIVGGILGGVIGNQFGRGRAKPVTTAAGTLLGASIAHDTRPPKGGEVVGYRQVERCETRYRLEEQEVVDHYLVTVHYNGRKRIFESDSKPGDTIELEVLPK